MVKQSGEAYTNATEKAEKDMEITHPVRLGLALNFSVFHYEIKDDPATAVKMAKETFDAAIADLDHMNDIHYKDCTTIMSLLRDNVTLWTSEIEEKEEKE